MSTGDMMSDSEQQDMRDAGRGHLLGEGSEVYQPSHRSITLHDHPDNDLGQNKCVICGEAITNEGWGWHHDGDTDGHNAIAPPVAVKQQLDDADYEAAMHAASEAREEQEAEQREAEIEAAELAGDAYYEGPDGDL